MFDLLKSLPEREAQDVLRRIRSGADITTVLSHVRAGNLLLQLAVTPETRFRYEFPYRSQMPDDYIQDNPYLDSLIFEGSSLFPPAQYSNGPDHHTSNSLNSLESAEYRSLYLKPFHGAQVMDPRLSDARPSFWTTVCSDDRLMRDMIAVFLRCEYQFTMIFHKDYFLEDMAAQRHDFCSSLLVNIVLAYSCVRETRACWRSLL